MKKRLLCLLLLLTLFMFLVGCTLIEKTEEPIVEINAPDSETFEKTNGAVGEGTSIPTEEPVDEAIVEEVEQEESAEVPKCRRQFLPTFSSGPHYIGPLFDAHFHMPNLIDRSKIPEGHGDSYGDDYGNDHGSSVTDPILGKDAELDKILCNFDNEDVIGVIGFVIGAEEVLGETISKAQSIKTDSSGKVNLFLMPIGFSKQSLENIEESNKGLFSGYGEIAFYDQRNMNILPDSQQMIEIYEVAGKNDLIVMFHPDGRQQTQVENAIKKNQNVKFLLHGPEAEGYITSLMDKYPNVYYSIDAVLARIPPAPAALMYMVSGKEEFKLKFDQNFDLMLDESEKSWKAKIEKYPNRFMWGTDRGHLWTYDEDVSVLLEEFGRALIARLDPEVQEKFAYKNAENLLQK